MSPSPVGTIQVFTNVAGADFSITGPESYNGSGPFFAKMDAPVGVYTISYGNVSGYATPANETKTLTAGGTITFNANYVAIPFISHLSTTEGVAGRRLTIIGTHFGATQGDSSVTFNTEAAPTVVSWNDTAIELFVPSLPPGSYDVAVKTSLGISNSVIFRIVQYQTIIVPGIFGTKLASANGVVWLSNGTISMGLADPQGGIVAFNELRYDSNGNPISPLTTTAITQSGDFGGLFNLSENSFDASYALNCNSNAVTLARFLGPVDCQKSVYVYNSLFDSLTRAGYLPHLFAYDWRQDIGTLSEQLFLEVQSQVSAEPNRPVALFAHSMGGLIVGEMLRRHTDLLTSLGPIVTLGTPFHGSPQAYLYFRGWKCLLPSCLILNAEGTRLVGGNWTSAYQLLPRWDFVRIRGAVFSYFDIYDGSLSNYSAWFPALPRSESALPLAYSLWRQVTPVYTQAHAIIGTGQLTGLELNDEARFGCLQLVQANGDKTVPLRSARAGSWIPSVNFKYVNEEHVGLPSNASVVGGILEILKTGQTTHPGLSASPYSGGTHHDLLACSPVTLSLSSKTGETVSDSFQEIPGGQYFALGEAKQIVVPANQDLTVSLVGTAVGTFTLLARRVSGDGELLATTSFVEIPVGVGSTAQAPISPSGIGALQLDIEGDGKFDFTLAAGSEPNKSQLVEMLDRIILNLGLPKGIEESLRAKIDAIRAAIARNNVNAARGSVGALMAEVQAHSGKQLNASAAEGLAKILKHLLAVLNA